jgi:hypothetical protein
MYGFHQGRSPYSIAQPRFPGGGRRAFFENPYEAGKGNQRRRIQHHKNEQFQREFMKRLSRGHRLAGMSSFGGARFPAFRPSHGLYRSPIFGLGRRTLFPHRMRHHLGHSPLAIGMHSRNPLHYPFMPHFSGAHARYRSPYTSGGWPSLGGFQRQSFSYPFHDGDDDDDDDDPFDDDDDEWGEFDPEDSYVLEGDRDYYTDPCPQRYPPFRGSYRGGYAGCTTNYDDRDDEGWSTIGSQYYGSSMGSGMGSDMGPSIRASLSYGCGPSFPYYGYSGMSGHSGYGGYSGYNKC